MYPSYISPQHLTLFHETEFYQSLKVYLLIGRTCRYILAEDSSIRGLWSCFYIGFRSRQTPYEYKILSYLMIAFSLFAIKEKVLEFEGDWKMPNTRREFYSIWQEMFNTREEIVAALIDRMKYLAFTILHIYCLNIFPREIP